MEAVTLLPRAGAPAGCEELLGPGPWADPTAGNSAASGSPAAHGLLLRQSVVLDTLAFTKKPLPLHQQKQNQQRTIAAWLLAVPSCNVASATDLHMPLDQPALNEAARHCPSHSSEHL